MRLSLSRAAQWAFVSVLLPCARYEFVSDIDTPDCDGFRRPEHRLLIVGADSTASARPDVLAGRILQRDTRAPVYGALVILLPDSARRVFTDRAGGFTLANVPPGHYQLLVMHPGFGAARDWLPMPLEGSAVELQLALQMTDGPCSGFTAVRVRKPWWKLW
jgi:hypothetical protein